MIGGSGGLGEAVVRRLSSRAGVVVGYRQNRDKAAALAAAINQAGGRAWSLPVDITVSGSVAVFFAQAAEVAGPIDHVVSVTGPSIPLCPLLEVEEADFRRIIETDVLGAFNVLEARHPRARAARRGLDHHVRDDGGAPYAGERQHVLGPQDRSRGAGAPCGARGLGPRNVRCCNAVAPGVIDAGIVHSAFVVSEVAKQVIKACLDRTPMPRMGRPEEVAALVDFLCSDAAAYVNGQVIAIDGGYSA